jgi:anti-sigma B factor antagonist
VFFEIKCCIFVGYEEIFYYSFDKFLLNNVAELCGFHKKHVQLFATQSVKFTMSKFSIEQKTNGAAEVFYLNGFLDAHTAPLLESTIAGAIGDGKHHIVVNFQDLEYISSAGLGVFMVFIEEVRATGGDIKLAAMKQKVFTVFDLLGFPMLFDITETEQEALSKFAA